MPYEHRVPTGRPDVDLTPEQVAAIRRVRNGSLLSQYQQGSLQAASLLANTEAAAEARAALDADAQRRKGRR